MMPVVQRIAIHHLFCTILAYSCYVSSFLLRRPQRTCTSFLQDRLHRKYNIPLNMFPHGLQLKATTKTIRWCGVWPLSYVMSLSLCSLGSGKAMTRGLPSKRYLRRGGPLAALVWELQLRIVKVNSFEPKTVKDCRLICGVGPSVQACTLLMELTLAGPQV